MKSLDQTKEEANKMRELLGTESKHNVPVGLGWFTGCPSQPESNHFHYVVDEVIKVSFIDKYNQFNTGYLYGFDYDVSERQYRSNVVIADNSGIITSGFINCICSISGLIPEPGMPNIVAPKLNLNPDIQKLVDAYNVVQDEIKAIVRKSFNIVGKDRERYDELNEMKRTRSYVNEA